MTIMMCDNIPLATGKRKKGSEQETGNSPRRVANDEEEEAKDREKPRSRRRHYPRWVAGRRDAAISTYRPPRHPPVSRFFFLSSPSPILFLSLPPEFTPARTQGVPFRTLSTLRQFRPFCRYAISRWCYRKHLRITNYENANEIWWLESCAIVTSSQITVDSINKFLNIAKIDYKTLSLVST